MAVEKYGVELSVSQSLSDDAVIGDLMRKHERNFIRRAFFPSDPNPFPIFHLFRRRRP